MNRSPTPHTNSLSPSLISQEYTLATNNGPNHLHGGTQGFDKRMWEGRTFENDRAVGVIFTLHSPDGDEGYPGNVTVQVRCVVWGGLGWV